MESSPEHRPATWSHLVVGGIWNEQALLGTPGSAIPPAKLATIQKAAVAACDALDGVKDGLIEDPRACHFDPTVLTCKGEDSNDCLTAAQVTALAKIYAGPKNPLTGEQIAAGFPPGTENGAGGWVAWIAPAQPAGAIQFFFANSYFGQAVFEQPQWDYREMDFVKDVALSDRKVGSIINSMNPDLRSFRAHGGKLLQYHGWGDPAISPMNSISYYDSVRGFFSTYPDARSDVSRPVQDFYRLFLVPGMGHCGGGAGPNRFDAVGALESWVEKGVLPEKLIGEGRVAGDAAKTMTRPLCPYPQMAHYKGSGDSNDAANFECTAAEQQR
jgi:feruloyl esterase